MIEFKQEIRFAFIALLALALSGCTRPDFVGFSYEPNPPLAQTGPLYPVKAQVLVFADNTPDFTQQVAVQAQGQSNVPIFAANLARASSPTWPQLTPVRLTEAFADELSASSLVESAQAVNAQTRQRGAKLTISGQILAAEVSYPLQDDLLTAVNDPEGLSGRWSFTLRLKAYAPLWGEKFNIEFWSNEFHVDLPRSGRRPNEDINQALQQLYGQALQDLQTALQKPDVARALGG